jgi:hypothetical protein
MQISLLAVLVAAVVSMILGGLWYGPLFGKVWIKLSGVKMPASKTEMKKTMTFGYGGGFVLSLLTAYVLAHFLVLMDVQDAPAAAQIAFWTWLGFSFPIMAESVLWEGKAFKLLALNAGFRLVALSVMALILAAF